MKRSYKYRPLRTFGLLSGITLLTLSQAAAAQEEAPETEEIVEVEAAAEVEAAEVEEAPVATTYDAPAAIEDTTEVPDPVMTKAIEATRTDDNAPDGLSVRGFVDAYYSYNTRSIYATAEDQPYPFHRAYARQNGFSLSFAGIDVEYNMGDFGFVTSLRFGPSVPIWYGGNQSNIGIENITQAYVVWRPTEGLTLDLGQFYTIYGAEVGESWQNLNYTRGALYYAMQPFWHTGLRATYEIEEFTFTGMLVNGVNTAFDGNDSPSVGLQAAYGDDLFDVSLGYLGAMQQNNGDEKNSLFGHFFDLVATLHTGDLTVILNADANTKSRENDAAADFWGISLAAGYQLTPAFGVALRGEYIDDLNNQLYKATDSSGDLLASTNVTTGTLTLDLKPIPDKDNLVIRWDNRIESSNAQIFTGKNNLPSYDWFSSTVGVVVHTDGF